jgi:hypothetical protein
MQKLILQEVLSQLKFEEQNNNMQSKLEKQLLIEDRKNSCIFRLIRAVELGATTCAYKKSKKGGKIAMKDIAEQQGMP